MASIVDDMKQGIAFLQDLRAKAADHKEDLTKAADALTSLAGIIKGVASGNPQKLDAQLTEWLALNQTLLALESAKQETAAVGSVDWAEISRMIATVARVGILVATAL